MMMMVMMMRPGSAGPLGGAAPRPALPRAAAEEEAAGRAQAADARGAREGAAHQVAGVAGGHPPPVLTPLLCVQGAGAVRGAAEGVGRAGPGLHRPQVPS